MKKEDLNKTFVNISEKIGKDNFAKIQDDLGIIITDNENTNKELIKKDETIADLEKDKNMLLQSNANLFQQVGMDDKNDFNNKREEDKPREKFSFKKAFDEKGNFI